MNFYACIWVKEGGLRLCMYVRQHIVSLYYRTTLRISTKVCRNEVLIAQHMRLCVSAISGQLGAKLGHGGPLLQKTSSLDQKATSTKCMHRNDLEAYGMKCCCFWFHFEAKFAAFCYISLDILLLPYFNVVGIDFMQLNVEWSKIERVPWDVRIA